ncbi:response regulator [Candidatus Saccharibacteria bacterium]|nr:response regulator [Candidatus Saccharibacteria bacterium]
MIYIIEDNDIMARCIARAAGKGLASKEYSASEIADLSPREVKIFHDAFAAIADLENGLPDLIFLDVLLTGVDGFTLLHELSSYEDTAAIPVILVTSINISGDLSAYGVRGILHKETMTPEEITAYVKEYAC